MIQIVFPDDGRSQCQWIKVLENIICKAERTVESMDTMPSFTDLWTNATFVLSEWLLEPRLELEL